MNTYHHGNLREALLEAGEVLLRERGVTGVSLREVAKSAGVSHGAPYRHFPNKQALLAGLAELGFARLRDAMHASARQFPDDPRSQLVDSGIAYVKLALANPPMCHLMFGGALATAPPPPSLQQTAGAAFQGLLTIIENGSAAGLYVERPPMELAATVWSLVHGLAMLASTGQLNRRDAPETDPVVLARIMIEHMLHGILV